jgi:hypothetical protein
MMGWSPHALLALALSATPLFFPCKALAEHDQLQAASGEYTRCIARSRGVLFHIVWGQGSQVACFNLGRKCTNDPHAIIDYFSNPIIINADYQRCTLWN